MEKKNWIEVGIIAVVLVAVVVLIWMMMQQDCNQLEEDEHRSCCEYCKSKGLGLAFAETSCDSITHCVCKDIFGNTYMQESYMI